MIKYLVLSLSMLTTCSVGTIQAQVVSVPEPRFEVTGVVTGSILKVAEAVSQLPAGDTVHLVIDSPGGQVYPGMQLSQALDAARTRGSRVSCYVLKMAASMAFQFLAHCDDRYVMANSLLLWHPVRVSVGMGARFTPRAASQLAADLRRVEDYLVMDLRTSFKLDQDQFLEHYHAETLHFGADLKRLTPGWVQLVVDIQIPGRTYTAPAPRVTPQGPTTLEYISPKVLKLWEATHAP